MVNRQSQARRLLCHSLLVLRMRRSANLFIRLIGSFLEFMVAVEATREPFNLVPALVDDLVHQLDYDFPRDV